MRFYKDFCKVFPAMAGRSDNQPELKQVKNRKPVEADKFKARKGLVNKPVPVSIQIRLGAEFSLVGMVCSDF